MAKTCTAASERHIELATHLLGIMTSNKRSTKKAAANTSMAMDSAMDVNPAQVVGAPGSS